MGRIRTISQNLLYLKKDSKSHKPTHEQPNRKKDTQSQINGHIANRCLNLRNTTNSHNFSTAENLDSPGLYKQCLQQAFGKKNRHGIVDFRDSGCKKYGNGIYFSTIWDFFASGHKQYCNFYYFGVLTFGASQSIYGQQIDIWSQYTATALKSVIGHAFVKPTHLVLQSLIYPK